MTLIRQPDRRPLEVSQALRDAQEALRGYESSALAGVAHSLTGAAEELSRTVQRLETMRPAEWLTAEQAAEYLGYISPGASDEERRKGTKAFEKAAQTVRMPRHDITPRVYRYSRRELDQWLLER